MDQYIGAITRLITQVDKPLTDIDEIDIDYYLRYYENRNVKNNRGKNQASTCNNERRYLSAFFTWLRKEKFVTYNPVECVEPKRERRKPIDYFRPGQMEELRGRMHYPERQGIGRSPEKHRGQGRRDRADQ